ncbi:hypothetical protein [Terriglobus sp. ADX1]|uniref:hypothetical protein n=1 Tax=Terriglobus sp. ADX1 TaxID=2794063 RepID=UPI002FE57446
MIRSRFAPVLLALACTTPVLHAQQTEAAVQTVAPVQTAANDNAVVAMAIPVDREAESSSLPDAPGMEQTQQSQDPHASNAGQAGHTPSGEPQQTQRILGIMPNFSAVSADTKLPPMTVKEKFVLATRNSFDYSSFVLAAFTAGFAMNGNSYPEFHQGVKGYARYYWHGLADTASENFMVSGAIPVVFHQDPRYYTLGHGGFKKRALYGATRIFVSRSDDGNAMPNYSEIIGAGAASGISSLYYPTRYRTWTKVGQKWLTSVLIDGAGYTFKEFWPDINHKIFHTH